MLFHCTDTHTHMHTEHGELQCGDGGRPAGVVLCVSAARDLRVQEFPGGRTACIELEKALKLRAALLCGGKSCPVMSLFKNHGLPLGQMKPAPQASHAD